MLALRELGMLSVERWMPRPRPKSTSPPRTAGISEWLSVRRAATAPRRRRLIPAPGTVSREGLTGGGESSCVSTEGPSRPGYRQPAERPPSCSCGFVSAAPQDILVPRASENPTSEVGTNPTSAVATEIETLDASVNEGVEVKNCESVAPLNDDERPRPTPLSAHNSVDGPLWLELRRRENAGGPSRSDRSVVAG